MLQITYAKNMNLKHLRKSNNVTQENVANAINSSRQNYSRYEKGDTEPNIKTLIKLADYFDVSLDYLCDRQYNNNIGYIPDSRKETIRKIAKLDDNEFNRVDAYITSILDSKNN